MTINDIRKWADEHVLMDRDSDDYYSLGNYTDIHKVMFTNGDSYKLVEKHDSNYNNLLSETYINGKLVNVSKYRFENFGWKLVSETTF